MNPSHRHAALRPRPAPPLLRSERMEHPVSMIRRSVASLRLSERYQDPAHPTRLLMQAVLEDGIRTFLRFSGGRAEGRPRARRLWNAELDWLTSTDRSHPFTYESICEALAIDAHTLRMRVLRMASVATPPAVDYSRAAPRGTMP
jgi:hypothetical protein